MGGFIAESDFFQVTLGWKVISEPVMDGGVQSRKDRLALERLPVSKNMIGTVSRTM